MSEEITARSLDAFQDESLLRAAYRWREDKPRWWRESMRLWEKPESEYLEAARSRFQADIGFFSNELLSCLITFVETAPGRFEVHIDSPRAAGLEFLIRCTLVAKQHFFDRGGGDIFIYVAHINRPILKLCERVGFRATNAGFLYGTVGNKVLEWREFRMLPPER